MELEKRVANLESLVSALIKRIDNDKCYMDANVDSARSNSNNGINKNSADIEKNTADIDYIMIMEDL